MGVIENNKKHIEELIIRLNDPLGSTMERRTLANSLKEMLKHEDAINKQLNGWKDMRQAANNFYADKLSYKEVKYEKITKYDLCSLFTDPHTNQNLDLNTKRFPIYWCHCQGIEIFFFG